MAEIALAIAPLCIEALKLSKKVTSKVKVLRGYTDEIEELRLLYQVQVVKFVSECERVIRKTIKDDPGINYNLLDFTDDNWAPVDLETRLKRYFGMAYASFEACLRSVHTIIDGFEKAFSYFDEVDKTGREGGSLFHRGRNGLRVVQNEEKWRKDLETLTKLIDSLRDLRKIADEKQNHTLTNLTLSTALPPHYRETRNASASFYNSITTNWSCSETNHSEHSAKLLLERYRQDKHSCLDVVIHKKEREVVDEEKCSLQFCIRSTELGFLTPVSTSSKETQQPSKRRRVRFSGDRLDSADITEKSNRDIDSPCASSNSYQESTLQIKEPLLLGRMKDICNHLKHSASEKVALNQCIGRLDSQGFMHQFFPGHNPKGTARGAVNGKLVDINGIFGRPLDESLSDPERLWLAATLIKSALQLYSTSWWPEDWTPHMLAFYENEDEDLAESLKSLHLTANLTPKSPEISASGRSFGQGNRAMIEYGIQNLTLWGLGVLLLQIGLWEPIDIGSHVEIREKVRELRYLGENYRIITNKLLNCDFGLGKYKLQEPTLRNEIYRTIVEELDAILNTLKMARLRAGRA